MKKYLLILVFQCSLLTYGQNSFFTRHNACTGNFNALIGNELDNSNFLIYYWCHMSEYKFSVIDQFGSVIKDFRIDNVSDPFNYYFVNSDNIFLCADLYDSTWHNSSIMLNRNFDIKWKQSQSSDKFYFKRSSFILDSDLNIYGFGYLNKYDSSTLEWNYIRYIAKSDSMGIVIWKKSLLDYHFSPDTFEFGDFDFFCDTLFFTVMNRVTNEIFMNRCTSNGEIIDKRIVNSCPSQYFIKLDDGFLLYFDGICRIDNDLNFNWRYKKYNSNYSINSLQIDKNNKLHILYKYETSNQTCEDDYFEFVRIKPNGEVIDSAVFKYIDGGFPPINTFKITSDGGYLICGGIEGEGFIMKTDSAYQFDTNFFQYTRIKKNLIKDSDIEFFPNPVSNHCTIQLNTNVINAIFSLYSVTGKIVRQQTISGENFVFERSELPGGFYIFTLISEALNFTGKLIIE